MQRTRVAFWLYLVENGGQRALAVALVHPLGVRGLALSLSVAYTVAAAVRPGGAARLAGPPGRPPGPGPRCAGWWLATVVMGVVVLVVSNLSGADHGPALFARVVGSVVVGVVVFAGVSVFLATRAERLGARRPRPHGRRPAAAGDRGGGVLRAGVAVRPAVGTVEGIRGLDETGTLVRGHGARRRDRMAGEATDDGRRPVVTDSACDLTDGWPRPHGITVVPLDHPFRRRGARRPPRPLPRPSSGAAARPAPALPETAAPSPGAFQEAFEAAAADGADGVVCLTISSGVSATYQSALAGGRGGRRADPGQVVDTRSLTMGQGLLCLAAAELAAGGAGLDEVVAPVGRA